MLGRIKHIVKKTPKIHPIVCENTKRYIKYETTNVFNKSVRKKNILSWSRKDVINYEIHNTNVNSNKNNKKNKTTKINDKKGDDVKEKTQNIPPFSYEQYQNRLSIITDISQIDSKNLFNSNKSNVTKMKTKNEYKNSAINRLRVWSSQINN